MAVKEQVIPISVGGLGLQAGVDPKQVNKGGLLRAENAIYPEEGIIGKRRGSAPMSGVHTESHMATYKDRPVLLEHMIKMLDGANMQAGVFNQAAGNLKLFDVDVTPKVAAEARAPYNCEVREVGSIRAWSYAIQNGALYDLHIETFEVNSGRPIATVTISTPTAGNNPQCRLVEVNGQLFYLYTSVTNIWIGEIDTGTGAIAVAINTLITGLQNNEPFDCVHIVGTTTIMCAGRDVPGTGLIVGMVDPVGASYTSVTVNPIGLVAAVGVWYKGDDEGVVAWWESTTLEVHALSFDVNLNNTSLNTVIDTVIVGAQVLNITGINTGPIEGHIYYTWGRPGVVQPVVYHSALTWNPIPPPKVIGFSAPAVIQRKASIATKPFTDATDQFFWVYFSAEKYAYLINGSGIHGGKVKPKRVYAQDSTWGTVAHGATNWVASCGGTTPWPTCMREMLDVDAETVSPFKVDNPRPTGVQTLEAQDALIIPNSMPYTFDGEDLVELGYLHVPESFNCTLGAAGNLTGVYFYRLTYRWRDKYHRLHESAPSPAVGVTGGNPAGNRVGVNLLPYLNHTRRGDVEVVLWRTKGNGSTYYRLFTFSNVVTQDTRAVYTDNIIDTALGAETLYTTGNILENIQPPASKVLCQHQNHLFFVDDENPGTRIFYSKYLSSGIAVEMTDTLSLSIPPEGGDITAIISFLDRLIICKETLIYYASGKGRSDTGTGYGYSDPVLLSETIGCTEQRSMVRIPDGIIFRAKDGIYTLTKKLAVSPIGKPVLFYVDPQTKRSGADLTIVRAVVQERRHVVVFFTSDGDALIYDYLYGRWAQWTNHMATDGCQAGNLLFWKVAATDKAWIEDQSTFEDDGAFYVLDLQTAYLTLLVGGIQVAWKILLGGQNIAPHTFNFQAMYDEEPTWTDTQEFLASALTTYDVNAHYGDGLSNFVGQGYVVEAELSRIEHGSIRFRVYDSAQGGSGESYSLSWAAMLAGRLTGTRHRGDARLMTPP
tara:strand:- start:49 stop:3036 length:2988 start_codon:yes stop_codon:yes gene_type:complete